jgi:hypothetical protein
VSDRARGVTSFFKGVFRLAVIYEQPMKNEGWAK